MVRGSTLVVSDLHVDTWSDRKIRQTGKSKQEHFFNLLDAAEQVGVRELVINGDLIDLPPYKGHRTFTQGSDAARELVERLISFGSKIPVTYVIGNHDIGVSGFRCMSADNIAPLRNLSCCYPDYVIDTFPNSTILIEHGHACDPFRGAYLWDLANRTYRKDRIEQMAWRMQRRNPKRPDERADPGALPTVEVAPGENAWEAARVGQKPFPKWKGWIKIRRAMHCVLNTTVLPVTEVWWWVYAVERMKSYLSQASEAGRKPKPTVYQIFGHTHRADPRDPEVHDGVNCIYINAGTWTEAVDEGWYVDINPDGKAWLQDWINEPAELRRVGVA